MLIGTEGVRTATGKDYFPELTTLIPQLALAHLVQHTPNGSDSYQWAIRSVPHALDSDPRFADLALSRALYKDDAPVGPYLAS